MKVSVSIPPRASPLFSSFFFQTFSLPFSSGGNRSFVVMNGANMAITGKKSKKYLLSRVQYKSPILLAAKMDDVNVAQYLLPHSHRNVSCVLFRDSEI